VGILGPSLALRVIAFALDLAWFALAHLSARTLNLSGSPKSAQPFGLFASVLSEGALREKWLGVQRRLSDDMVQLALCEGDRNGCISPAALQFLAVVDNAKAREGRARLGEINRAINLAIRPMSDLAEHGKIDVWSSPLATLAKGAGDDIVNWSR
jgi:predicted transglutaminase-like cysteine proteinase